MRAIEVIAISPKAVTRALEDDPQLNYESPQNVYNNLTLILSGVVIDLSALKVPHNQKTIVATSFREPWLIFQPSLYLFMRAFKLFLYLNGMYTCHQQYIFFRIIDTLTTKIDNIFELSPREPWSYFFMSLPCNVILTRCGLIEKVQHQFFFIRLYIRTLPIKSVLYRVHSVVYFLPPNSYRAEFDASSI